MSNNEKVMWVAVLVIFALLCWVVGSVYADTGQLLYKAPVKCAGGVAYSAEGVTASPLVDMVPAPEVIPLKYLPKDDCGHVDWAGALEDGTVAPRDSIMEKRVDSGYADWPGEVLLKAREPVMPDVVFRHETHNELLECKSCHPGIFKEKARSAEITMRDIYQGEYCGRCHGKVSFPVSSCYRCHTQTPVITSK
jgi:c(7)-type cytochrome triheme protein